MVVYLVGIDQHDCHAIFYVYHNTYTFQKIEHFYLFKYSPASAIVLGKNDVNMANTTKH